MATKIVTKNSSTGGSAPSASDLVQGELAVNVTDKRLYTENASGAVVELGTNPLGAVTMASTLQVDGAATFTTEITANGGIALGDNDKATFGAGDDLQIYHDGSNSYIDEVGTGNLKIKSNGSFIDIQSNSTRINNAANNEIMATFVANGGVTLYHDNASKIATTATGIDVTGTATMDGLSVDGATTIKVATGANTVKVLNVYSTDGSTNNAQVRSWFGAGEYDTAGRGLLLDTGRDSGGDGVATFYSVDQSEHSDYEAIKILTDGGVTLSHKGANKLATTSSGIDVTGTVHISTAVDTVALFESTDSNSRIELKDGAGSSFVENGGGILRLKADNANAVANSRIDFTIDNSEKMRITTAGNLLVGTSAIPTDNNDSLGFGVTSSGEVRASVNGANAAMFKRATSDGDIIEFRKDSTTVGSIGTRANDLSIGNGDTGLNFWDASNKIIPENLSTGAARDDAISLGASNVRFKDLYLSGAANVGSVVATGNVAVAGTVDGVDIATRDGVLSSTTTTAGAALPKAGGAMTGAITTNSTFDGVDIATRDGVLSSTTTTANAALPKAGGAMTGAITTNSTFDGVDIATRDGVLTTTTNTANAALPKAGGTMTGVAVFAAGITEDAVTLTGTSTTIDISAATNFVHDLTGATTYTFSNPASTGNASSFTLKIIQDSTARAITWPSSVDWAGGTAPTLTGTNNGVDVFVFYTIDGGTIYYGFTAGQAMA